MMNTVHIAKTSSQIFKHFLTQLGQQCSERSIHRLDVAIDCLETGRWMKSRGFLPTKYLHTREQIFELIANEIGRDPVLYLEFGVYQGRSMRIWSNLLEDTLSHLHGFDTFEGLPERWNARAEQGRFSLHGDMPVFDDPRVILFKGIFEDSLRNYKMPSHERLVINIDADLYSSAIVVLRELQPFMIPGTYLYFDEFSDRQHELRAFDEFLQSSGMAFALRGCDHTLSHVVFQRVA
jgi:hypothetical protein